MGSAPKYATSFPGVEKRSQATELLRELGVLAGHRDHLGVGKVLLKRTGARLDLADAFEQVGHLSASPPPYHEGHPGHPGG